MSDSLIRVRRVIPSEKSTIGEMYFNDVFLCNTLEDTVRPQGVKIFGKTAIPAGTYKIDMLFWQIYNDNYPHLIDVPNFEGILIHPGIVPEHTEGCILPGLYDVNIPDQLHDSRLIYRNIVLRNIKEALSKGKLFCEVVNDFPDRNNIV